MPYEIRLLTAADAVPYAHTRLRMLRDHPENFGSAVEDEAGQTQADYAARLTPRKDPPEHLMFGAFDAQGELHGMVGLFINQRHKENHKATVGSMYTAPEARGSGLGRRLLEHCVAEARRIGGLDLLLLAVSAGNAAAENLYASCGFVRYGVEPRAIRTGGRDIDKVLMALDLR